MNKPIRHGEIILAPVSALPEGKVTKHTNYIVGHSETGHHHVLEATKPFTRVEDAFDNIFFKLVSPTNIVHKKTTEKHRTLTLDKGIYKRYHDTEYSPWTKLIRDVAD